MTLTTDPTDPPPQDGSGAADADEGVVEAPRSGWRPVTALVTAGVGVVAWLWNPFLAATIIALMVVIAVHELGHLLVARRAGMATPEYMVGFGPTVWSTSRGGTEWGLKAVPLGGYVRILGMSDVETVDEADEARTYRAAPWRWKVAVSAAGPVANLTLAVVLLAVVLTVWGRPALSDEPVVGAVVAEVAAGTRSPAAAAGLRAGDEIRRIGDVDVDSWDDMVTALGSGRAGQPVQVVVRRGDRETEVSLRPVLVDGRHVIGVQRSEYRQRFGPVSATGESVRAVGTGVLTAVDAVGDAASGMGTYASSVFRGRDVPDEERFLSPIGAAQVAQSASRNGVAEVLGLAAVVNVMLGVFNLLPVPPLDGGHIVVATMERLASLVRRRPVKVPTRVLLPVTYAMWLVLMAVGMSAIWLDIVDPVKL